MPMTLTPVERARVADSRLKVQSVAQSLKYVDPNKIPDLEEIADCLEDADQSLGEALQASPPNVAPDKGKTPRK